MGGTAALSASRFVTRRTRHRHPPRIALRGPPAFRGHDGLVPSVYEPRVPPADSPAHVHKAALYRPRLQLDALRRHHLQLVKRFLALDPGLLTIDLVMVAVARRSYHLVHGFLALFDEWNVVAAAPLVRMQLDNLTRLSYVSRAPKSDEVVEEVIGGVEFRKMKDNIGQQLRDGRLVELAGEHHSWLPPVYEATSGWVHLSPVHVYTSWQVNSDDDAPSFSGHFPGNSADIPEPMLAELIGAMVQATEEVFGYIELWESRKGLPPGEMRNLGDTD